LQAALEKQPGGLREEPPRGERGRPGRTISPGPRRAQRRPGWPGDAGRSLGPAGSSWVLLVPGPVCVWHCSDRTGFRSKGTSDQVGQHARDKATHAIRTQNLYHHGCLPPARVKAGFLPSEQEEVRSEAVGAARGWSLSSQSQRAITRSGRTAFRRR
jgi:hypothetical protein